MVTGSSFIARVMLSLAETGWSGMAVPTDSGVLMAAVGLGRGVGLAIPGKAAVGEAGASVPPGCTVGAAVVPQAMAASATAVVIHVCQCPFSLTKSSLLSRWREIRNLCFYSGSEALTRY